jgi:hypothetical protein
MNARILLAAAATLLMAGAAAQAWAQDDDATKAAENDAKEATQMATPSASDMGFGNSGSSSSGSSHTESSSSSTSFSVTVGSAPPPGWGPAHDSHHGPNPNSGAALNGEWKLASADGGRSCGLRLSDGDNTDDAHGAWTNAGGPDGTFGVNRWRYDGHRLVLTSGIGDTVAEFRRVGANRFEGRNVKSGERLVISR